MTTTTAKTAKGVKSPKASKKAAKGIKSPKTPRVKKEGLRAPQVRILAYLAKVKSPKTRKDIIIGAPIDHTMGAEYLGSYDPDIRAKNDAKFWPSLHTLGYVKVVPGGEDGTTPAYEITAKGRKALEKATKE